MLYTIGYSGRSLDDIAHLLQIDAALLVDVRYTPASRWRPKFRTHHLATHCGARYVWCQALGNRNYKGGPIQLADYPAGLAQVRTLLETHAALVLMCIGSEVETCHRTMAAAQLSQALQVPLTHLMDLRGPLYRHASCAISDASVTIPSPQKGAP
jgi:uncharacterized protein (DUF488 family)